MTLPNASEISSPISLSSPAEMVATFTMSPSVTGFARAFSSSSKNAVVFSIPFRSATGFTPAATTFIPSFTNAWVSTVAVVVPSPAISFVLDATSFSSCAPAFSKGFDRLISFAIIIPSFTMLGLPPAFSRTTLRPFGPIVIRTASARALTPLARDCRESSLNETSLAIDPCTETAIGVVATTKLPREFDHR